MSRSPRSFTRAPLFGALLAAVGCAAGSIVGCADAFAGALDGVPDTQAPFSVALAGADLAVIEGQRVQLSGAASRGDAGAVRLVWTQLEGPPVSLTNPSAAAPTFIAPLSPATLVFSLQAEGSVTDVDTVTVTVGTTRQPPAGYVLAPPDATAKPGDEVRFELDAAEADGDVTFSARSACAAALDVTGSTVTYSLPTVLPCAVTLDAVTTDGRALAPAARVFWPEGTPLPSPTRFTAGAVGVLPAASVVLSFAELAAEDRATGFGAYGGNALAEPIDSDVVVFTAPRRPGRLVVGGEVRRGGASGGVRFALIDVSPGSGNTAPIARGGPDRIVLPGARFRFDVGASFDADSDPLLVTSTQVIGVPAEADMSGSQVFIAPASEGTLLFHVVADDGTVLSMPDPVRVVIDEAAENLRPVLSLPSELFVRPGQMFMIDASGAQDPDSGFIASFFIAQSDEDVDRLLGEPLTSPTASFVAQDAGDVYHFLVSAFDEGGLGTTAAVTVIVEEAGPYVDPVRGSDDTGNGTAPQPFASIAGALPTAARHAFEALLLAEGAHASPPPLLPPGLDLIGRFRFADEAYARADDAITSLPITTPTTLSSAAAEGLVLEVTPTAALHLRDGAVLLDTVVTPLPGARTEALVVVDADTHARLDGAVVHAGPSEGAAALRVQAGAVVASVETSLAGGTGDNAIALACDGGTVVVNGGDITGSAGSAARSVGIEAVECVIVISDATVQGGTGDSATGLSAMSSLVSADGGSSLVGRTAAGGSGVGVSIADDASPLFVEGVVSASSLVEDQPLLLDEANAVVLFGARAELGGARVRAAAPGARGIVAIGGALSATDTDTRVSGVDAHAVALDGAVVAMFVDSALTVLGTDGVGIAVSGAAAELRLTATSVEAGAVGVLAPEAALAASASVVVVSGDSGARAPRGVTVRSFDLDDTSVFVDGDGAVGLENVEPSSIDRAVVVVTSQGADCVAVRAASVFTVTSSYLDAASVGCIGIESADAALTLVHATVRAGTALSWSGTLTLRNSVLAGAPAINTTEDTPFSEAIGLAVDDVTPLAVTAGGPLVDVAALEQRGCDLCSVVSVSALVDNTGHLVDGVNPLVDSADPAVSTPLDIDGEARPIGVRPDLGCDER